MTSEQRVKLELLREKFGNGLVTALRHTRDEIATRRQFPGDVRVEEAIDELYEKCEQRT